LQRSKICKKGLTRKGGCGKIQKTYLKSGLKNETEGSAEMMRMWMMCCGAAAKLLSGQQAA